MTEETIADVMEAEVAAWEQTLPQYDHRLEPDVATAVAVRVKGGSRMQHSPVYPHPCEPGGMPDGWVAHHVHHQTAAINGEEVVDDLILVERTGGGWTMMLHWTQMGGSTATVKWRYASLTLAGLYAKTAVPAHQGTAVERHLRAYIVSRYDLSDPTEAAEVTLLGLGAPITVMPRALS